MISAVVSARARYSASVEERDTTSCFLLFQAIREEPRKIENHVVDFLSLTSPAQSESEKAVKVSEL